MFTSAEVSCRAAPPSLAIAKICMRSPAGAGRATGRRIDRDDPRLRKPRNAVVLPRVEQDPSAVRCPVGRTDFEAEISQTDLGTSGRGNQPGVVGAARRLVQRHRAARSVRVERHPPAVGRPHRPHVFAVPDDPRACRRRLPSGRVDGDTPAVHVETVIGEAVVPPPIENTTISGTGALCVQNSEPAAVKGQQSSPGSGCTPRSLPLWRSRA
jgi:hypothetical protein